jgi:hypothetical protein
VPQTQAHRPCGSGNCGTKLQKNFRIKIYQLHEAPSVPKTTGGCFEFLQPAGRTFIFRLEPLSDFWNSLVPAKLKRTVFCIDGDSLAFSDFAFEDVDAERIENFLLNSAAERTRTQTRIVPFAREEFLR